jgi:hypothetical protein
MLAVNFTAAWLFMRLVVASDLLQQHQLLAGTQAKQRCAPACFDAACLACCQARCCTGETLFPAVAGLLRSFSCCAGLLPLPSAVARPGKLGTGGRQLQLLLPLLSVDDS